jgi:hypothetical protein
VSRAPLWLSPCLALGLACAGAQPPLPAGASAAPARGDSLALLVTQLHHAEGAPADVELRELRMMAVDREPWRPLDARAAGGHPGRVAVVAGRRCSWRAGLSRHEVERASWFVLDAGALAAFDHQGFGAECASRPAFEPAGAGDVALERALMRYLSQRWPVSEIPGEQRLARGLRLLERGRTEDAAYELHALDRRIDELGRRQTEHETPDAAERERLREEQERLRPLRAQLHRALAERVTTEGGGP